MEVRFRAKVNRPVAGREIAVAVKELASGREYIQRLVVTGDVQLYLVGQGTICPARDFAIGVGPGAQPQLDLTMWYEEIYVVSYQHDGAKKCSVSCEGSFLIDGVRDFRDRLEKLLRK